MHINGTHDVWFSVESSSMQSRNGDDETSSEEILPSGIWFYSVCTHCHLISLIGNYYAMSTDRRPFPPIIGSTLETTSGNV